MCASVFPAPVPRSYRAPWRKKTTKVKVKHNTKPTSVGSRRNETYDGSDVELTLPLAANPGWASINSCLSLLIAVLYRCTALLACLLICTAYLHFNVNNKLGQQYSTGRYLVVSPSTKVYFSGFPAYTRKRKINVAVLVPACEIALGRLLLFDGQLIHLNTWYNIIAYIMVPYYVLTQILGDG